MNSGFIRRDMHLAESRSCLFGPTRDLEAWQLGMEFVLDIYRVTKTFPREESH